MEVHADRGRHAVHTGTPIAGIFGMNFRIMPLLQNPDGCWITMGMMATIARLMGLIFWCRQ